MLVSVILDFRRKVNIFAKVFNAFNYQPLVFDLIMLLYVRVCCSSFVEAKTSAQLALKMHEFAYNCGKLETF